LSEPIEDLDAAAADPVFATRDVPMAAAGDTLWSDVSEFQPGVTDAYPHKFFALRSHDGGHNDAQFMHNITWANRAVASGRLWGYIVYYFYRPGFDGAAALKARVGPHPNPKMVAMIDVESAGGQVHGNQSAQISREFHEIAGWLGSSKRVIGYGNTSDLNSLWPARPAGIRLIIAAYGSNPGYPGKFAHQFTDCAHTPPFGPSDLNSADGMSAHDLQVMFGMTSAPAPAPAPHPVSHQMAGTLRGPVKHGTGHWWTADGTLSLAAVAARRNAAALNLLRASAVNCSPAEFAALNRYLMGGITKPMPRGLVFYTVNT
jgi:hypothetical protein